MKLTSALSSWFDGIRFLSSFQNDPRLREICETYGSLSESAREVILAKFRSDLRVQELCSQFDSLSDEQKERFTRSLLGKAKLDEDTELN